MIHIQAVHLPQPAAQILGVTLRVFLRPPIPHGKVEHAVRAKGERPTIVVVCRLCHRTKFSGRLPRIPQAILTGSVFPEYRPPLLLPQGLMFEEVASVGGKLRMKGQTHQTFPRSVTDGSTEVTKETLVGRGLIGKIQTPGLATTVLQYHPLAFMPGDGCHPHGAIPRQALGQRDACDGRIQLLGAGENHRRRRQGRSLRLGQEGRAPGVQKHQPSPHHPAAGLKEGKQPSPPRNPRYLRYSRSPGQVHGQGRTAETTESPQKADRRLHHEPHCTTP